MKKLAFIDHSFKRKTVSSAFLIDQFKKYYDVKIFWDESWSGGPKIDLRLITDGGFDVLVLFQQMSYYTAEELHFLNCPVVLIPMYDADGSKSDLFLYKYRKFKFINFSKTLHQRLQNIGIETFYCQYFMTAPEVELISPPKQNHPQLKGFFWQRTDAITWAEIKKLIEAANFKEIHIHTAIDPPGYDLILPSEQDRLRYRITTSDWFATKGDYLKKVAECHVFFAPRLYEGIGMAFIEAMAMGKCVVAPNNPTMNEYITDGYNGLLYDPEDPQPLDFSNIETICENARKYISDGFAHWPEKQKQLLNFIKEPGKKNLSLPVLINRLRLHLKYRKRKAGKV